MTTFIIPVAAVFGSFVFLIILITVTLAVKASSRRSANQQAHMLYAQSRSPQAPGQVSLEDALKSGFEAGIRNQVQIRLKEEAQTDRGERVWALHHISNGELKHRALFAHGHKYELRRAISQKTRGAGSDMEKGDSLKDNWIGVGGWGKRYEYRIQPCQINEERRKAAAAVPQSPDLDGCYTSLIGWTRKSKGEVDAACKSTLEKYGFDNVFRDIRQGLMRNFASQIVKDAADGWGWFYPSPASNDRYVLLGSVGGRAVVATEWLQRLKEMRPLMEGQDRVNLEANIEKNEKFLDRQTTAFVEVEEEEMTVMMVDGVGEEEEEEVDGEEMEADSADLAEEVEEMEVVVVVEEEEGAVEDDFLTFTAILVVSVQPHSAHDYPSPARSVAALPLSASPSASPTMDRPSTSSDAASTFSGSTACSYTKDAPPAAEAKAARRGMRQRVRDVVHELGRPPTAKQDAKDGKTTQNHVDIGPAGAGLMAPGAV
ncbi:hypothetical protein EDB80DRAFT_885353 [Ilyonectria destructans]|nr:hypothetical protein EDB80DRAFT_885353 [Ilyonectria destructans]